MAINWVAQRPGVASVILGASRLSQIDETLTALDFELPTELRARLDALSAPVLRFPYTLFIAGFQTALHAGAQVGDKPPTYRSGIVIPGRIASRNRSG